MKKRNFEVTMECNGEDIVLTIYDIESCLHKEIKMPYCPDEHPEFDSEVGKEFYSWAELMMDE